ncbi:hypothetical protein NBRC116188_19610 [Oceaniserpentilla sp. 4NH20-0058]|uniref:hypothetical protein n=1 Tax=Oceaniserpentilla sp. 4NH20-0058 TaxID=3127660 RepID=UPI00310A2AD6
MTSTTMNFPADADQHLKGNSPNKPVMNTLYENNKKWLFALYLVVPVCVLFVLIDHFLLNGMMQQALPRHPVEWAFWAIFFNFPHIVSSFITLADKEYLGVYKKNITYSLLAITAFMGLIFFTMSLFPGRVAFRIETLFLIFIAIYTMYHVMSQQYGLSLMMMQRPANLNYQFWRWSSVLVATILYIHVFMKGYIYKMTVFTLPLADVLLYIAALLMIVSTIAGMKIGLSSNTKLGRYYVFGNIAMVIACYFCLEMGYSVFVILMPRVIHDITAFMIYSGHDQNRNANGYKNFIYGSLSFLKIPPRFLNPILAIVIAALVDYFAGYRTMGMIIIFCGLFHYYMEGIMWKGNSIHRKSLKFS